jgi:hypothetical protein
VRLRQLGLHYGGSFSIRRVVWKSSQQTWAELHEQAFRYLGGCPQYVVLDNLKEGAIKPDLYEPELNTVYAATLDHYGVVADPARVRDPNRKGSVENVNPSRETRLILRQAAEIGPQASRMCQLLFAIEGRVGQRKLWGIVGLHKRFPASCVDAACAQALEQVVTRYAADWYAFPKGPMMTLPRPS